jgi:hypothetical protein
MAQLPQPFNAHAVEPSAPASALPVSGPEGHPVIITANEFKQAKSGGNNGFAELTLQIIDGEFKGQTGPYRLNIFHDNPQTVAIAQAQLSALCHVTGQMMISNLDQLHNIPFRAIVGMQKKQQPTDPDYTEIKGVLDIQGNKPGKAGQNHAAPQAAAAPPAWNQAPGQPAQPQQPQAASPVPWGQPQGGGAPAADGKPPWAK